MKERPILMNAAMVRAVLAGRNTQTRRLVKPQPIYDASRAKWVRTSASGVATWSGDRPEAAALVGLRGECPFGVVGDRLWVREAWGLHGYGDFTWWCRDSIRGRAEDDLRSVYQVAYAADATSPYDFWRPSIHMPRWASRITLEVTGVRVERLTDITEKGARAEGVEPLTAEKLHPIASDQTLTTGERMLDQPHRGAFAWLWDEINGDRALWKSNPWVWVVSFRRVERQERAA